MFKTIKQYLFSLCWPALTVFRVQHMTMADGSPALRIELITDGRLTMAECAPTLCKVARKNGYDFNGRMHSTPSMPYGIGTELRIVWLFERLQPRPFLLRRGKA